MEPYPTPETRLGTAAQPGEHIVYHLCARLRGVAPEQEVAHVYVGVTSNLPARIRAHSRKWWWPTIDADLSCLEAFPTRADAEAYERQLIHWHQPAMNRAGRLLLVTT
jgi:hypothetical protein